MRPIFKNPELSARFERDHYFVTPFLGPKEVQQLRDIYDELAEDQGGKFHLSLWTKNIENRKLVHRRIMEVFQPFADALLDNYKTIISSYAIKKPAQDSHWHVHQDDHFLDERKHTSLSIWVPLQDVNSKNGAMQILKGSHQMFTDIRTPNIPKPYDGYKDLIKEKYLTTIEMKAGEGLIFDHKLVHASGPNLSDAIRFAAVAVFAPQEAELMFYYKDPHPDATEVETLRLADNFYQEFPLGDKPEGEGVEFVEVNPMHLSVMTASQFEKKYREINDEHTGLFQKFFSRFKK